MSGVNGGAIVLWLVGCPIFGLSFSSIHMPVIYYGHRRVRAVAVQFGIIEYLCILSWDVNSVVYDVVDWVWAVV